MARMMVYCLTEGGEVHGKTIRDHEWEEHEKNGYKANPLHLPKTVRGELKKFCPDLIE